MQGLEVSGSEPYPQRPVAARAGLKHTKAAVWHRTTVSIRYLEIFLHRKLDQVQLFYCCIVTHVRRAYSTDMCSNGYMHVFEAQSILEDEDKVIALH